MAGQVDNGVIRFEARAAGASPRGASWTRRRRHTREAARLRHADPLRRDQLQELPGCLRRSRRRGTTPSWRRLRGTSFDSLKQAHIADHQRLFRRVTLDLGRRAAAGSPTDERIRAFADGRRSAAGGAALPVRPLPADRLQPRRAASRPTCRGSGTTASARRGTASTPCNINTEMNYWPAEPTQPGRVPRAAVRRARRSWPSPGAKTAQGALRRARLGAAPQLRPVARHGARSTPPTTASGPPAARGCASTSGSTTCSRGDQEFLRERGLSADERRGAVLRRLPGRGPATTGLADQRPQQLAGAGRPGHGADDGPPDHPRACSARSSPPARSSASTRTCATQLDDMRARIAPNQIGKYGQLQEWLEDKDDPKNQHRHVSHLWGVYPGARDHAARHAGPVRRGPEVARVPRRRGHRLDAWAGRSTSGPASWTATTPTASCRT